MQEFFINKNSILPILQVDLIDDGRHNYQNFYEYIQNSKIFFNMVDIETGVVKIAHQPCVLVLKETTDCTEQYIITYKWRDRDVDRVGRYRGQFELKMDGTLPNQPSGNLIVPIYDELIINIMDGLIKK